MICCGADVGTNLIDGHANPTHDPPVGKVGADVGTNLIDGHSSPISFLRFLDGADVGTNLIDGHTIRKHKVYPSK